MDPGIIQFLPHTSKQHLDFINSPVKSPCNWSHGNRLQRASSILIVPNSQLFVFLVLWPVIDRPLETHIDDLGKACLRQDIFEFMNTFIGLLELERSLVEKLTPFCDGAVGGQGTVVGSSDYIDFLDFDPATGRQIPGTVSNLE